MDIKEFISKRPYLYHLTHKKNYNNILEDGLILSTKEIVGKSDLENSFLRKRRSTHTTLTVEGVEYHIRDQQPIFPVALKKCLTDGWEPGDFIEHLNNRVFFWPTLKRLKPHFNRYQEENPVIFRVKTNSLINENSDNPPLFCRLNSGATRPNPYLGGIAPQRGPNTFKTAENYDDIVSSVAEVTFEESCKMPKEVEVGKNPDGPWEKLNLNDNDKGHN